MTLTEHRKKASVANIAEVTQKVAMVRSPKSRPAMAVPRSAQQIMTMTMGRSMKVSVSVRRPPRRADAAAGTRRA